MKYPVYAFLALSLFFLSSCKNTTAAPETPGTTDTLVPADGTGAAGTSGTVGNPASPLTGDAAALYKQIQNDFFAGRAISHKLDSSYAQVMTLVLAMKNVWAGAGEKNQQQIRQIHEGIMQFTNVYEEHRMQTGKLDSLSIYLTQGRIAPAEAQKQYETTKQAIQVATGKLPTPAEVSQNLKASKVQFEQIFSSANKRAAGH